MVPVEAATCCGKVDITMTKPRLESDVIIVGAGLSGIGAAWRLRQGIPDLSVQILESRAHLGGTWDLFRYPGVRSDSDILSYSYPFRPWPGERGLAEGGLILDYLQDTADSTGISDLITFNRRVLRAQWSTDQAQWTVTAAAPDGSNEHYTCRFLYVCTGYFSYDAGYTPQFVGEEDFGGQIVHPQHWPEGLDYTDARVVIIGSGATAVTLVPAMAANAAHVTMLQRSPGYVIPLPSPKPASGLSARVPRRVRHGLMRSRGIAANQAFYAYCRARPQSARRLLRRLQLAYLRDETALVEHFDPRYEPWDQRLCASPDGDVFTAIASGQATVVTDHIDRFVPEGVQLRSGEVVPADIIVTATGLNLQALGGINLEVDGAEVKLPELYAYRGMMLSGVPNLAFTVGYSNASWTLRADLTARYVTRLLRHMREGGLRSATPSPPAGMSRRPLLSLMAGYLRRAGHLFPTHGDTGPWYTPGNYLRDRWLLPRADLTEDMNFTSQ